MRPTHLINTPLGPFTVYTEGTITRALQAGAWWDDHLKPLLDEVETGCAIDIGAHFGWFTCYLAQYHSRVIAIEPWPQSFALLTDNLQRRPGLEHRVQCWPVAAYDRPAILHQFGDPTDAGSFAFGPRPTGGWAALGMCLDPYIPPDADVTLIKCDAQGADLKALEGLEGTIMRCKPLIVWEWEAGLAQQQGDTWEDYLRFFLEIDYSVERITTDYWDYVSRPLR